MWNEREEDGAVSSYSSSPSVNLRVLFFIESGVPHYSPDGPRSSQDVRSGLAMYSLSRTVEGHPTAPF